MTRTLKIGSNKIGNGNPCFVVAEIGINHNGDIELAKKMILAAGLAGCNAVKFQKRTIPVVYTQGDLAKKRQIPPTNGIMKNAIKRGVLSEKAVQRLTSSDFEDTTNGDLKWALEFTENEYREIDAFCKGVGIIWFASPWDEESIDFLQCFDPLCYKVASACLTDFDLLSKLENTGKPIILATGMSTMEEINKAVEILNRKNLIILHAISEYPPQDCDLNISMIKTLIEMFPDIPIGYSGHEKDIIPSVVAVAMGACVVERHLTLDRRLWGTDHAASLEPEEFREMVEQIRRVSLFMGDGQKKISHNEMEIMKKLRRKYGFGGV